MYNTREKCLKYHQRWRRKNRIRVRIKQRAANKRYYRRNKKKMLAGNLTWVRRKRLTDPEWHARALGYQRKYYKENKKRIDNRNILFQRQLKLKVFRAYGGKCKCCGETEHWFLTIDHVNNDGHKHKTKGRRYKGLSLYRWLWKHSCPKKRFQLLCANCQLAKSFFGKCIHKKPAGPLFRGRLSGGR